MTLGNVRRILACDLSRPFASYLLRPHQSLSNAANWLVTQLTIVQGFGCSYTWYLNMSLVINQTEDLITSPMHQNLRSDGVPILGSDR
jgi:hypothetical protein